MFKRLTIIFFLLFSAFCFSQNQTKFWYFGNNAGLDFNPGTPSVVTNGSLNTTEGCSAISDASGNLLFYTDGVSVWNKNNVVMPNGTGLLGDPSTTQSGLIVKKPGSVNLYYIFTLPAEGVGDFNFSVVDMSLNAGNGDITTKNTFIRSNVTEKLTAVHHCNGTDIWVMIHESGTNAFSAYPVTATGIGTAVVSNVGGIHTDVHGQMKFNNNGTKIACIRDTVTQPNPYNGIAYADVLNFNNQTGVVSNPIALNLNNAQKAYGLEFSQDNTKLYASYYDVTGINGGNSNIIQYNVTATNVAASGATVGASFDPDILRALQLGPDGKIYIAKSNTPFLCVINSPNAAGAACSYSDNAINLDPNFAGTTAQLGLPGFVTSYFNPAFPAIATCTTSTVTGIYSAGPIQNTKIYFDNSANRLIVSAEIKETGNFTFEMADLLGRSVYLYKGEVSTGGENNFQFSIPSCITGIYIAKLSIGNSKYQTKFIKE